MLISEDVQMFVKCLKSVNAKWASATEVFTKVVTIIGRPLFIYCSWYFVTNWLDDWINKPGIRIEDEF